MYHNREVTYQIHKNIKNHDSNFLVTFFVILTGIRTSFRTIWNHKEKFSFALPDRQIDSAFMIPDYEA